MQNQNIHPWSWGQGAAPTFPGAQPLIPTNFPPPGVDLSGYPQMYGNPPGQVVSKIILFPFWLINSWAT